jgi:hypothetical protein
VISSVVCPGERAPGGQPVVLPSRRSYVDPSAYGITWGRAREAAPTLAEHALELAKRPYDLRHAGISFWLACGVDPAECARRAGQSIQVLFRYYAKFLAAARNHVNSLIEESMRRWEGQGVFGGAGEAAGGQVRKT